jgi:hypothetical protein
MFEVGDRERERERKADQGNDSTIDRSIIIILVTCTQTLANTHTHLLDQLCVLSYHYLAITVRQLVSMNDYIQAH